MGMIAWQSAFLLSQLPLSLMVFVFVKTLRSFGPFRPGSPMAELLVRLKPAAQLMSAAF